MSDKSIKGKQTQSSFAKRKDLIIIGGLLLAALVIWGVFAIINSTKTDLRAEIYYGNTLVQTVPLYKDQVIEVSPNLDVQLEVRDNAICFVHSDCPDQVCVHTGWLNGSGQFAACLPNSVMVWVEGESSGGNDIVVR